VGVAVPYLNSSEITFEKGYYAGGANDMRGWKFRTLGPGGYQGSGEYERIGEIQLETNLEYRFPIYSFFKGALFTDIGNIWTMRKTETYPDGNFVWSTFYKQLAMDMGVGLRFDFTYFVFRLDMAIPVRNPAYPEDERWRFKYLQFNDFVFNLGIGYPF
jgi:outer membrane protein assembly factor BamA